MLASKDAGRWMQDRYEEVAICGFRISAGLRECEARSNPYLADNT